MNDRSFDQLLNAWMDLGPTTAPDRVADAARLEAATTRQSPAILSRWAPRRFPVMNTTAKVILASAAVVVAALIGYTYLIAPNVGGPGIGEPTPSPTPAPTPAPTPLADLGDVSGNLQAASYTISDVEPFEITITVPSGWEKLQVPAMLWTTSDEKSAVAYFTVSDLYADPCDAAQGLAGIGPTADELAEALSTYPGITVDSRTDVTISGHSGTLLEYSAEDVGCDEGVMWSTDPQGDLPHPGASDNLFSRWYIVDVDGGRLMIGAGAPASASDQQVADVDSIVESTRIAAP